MPSNLSDRRVSPLRARMIEDMTMRGFTEKTRQDYVRHVRAFAAFMGRSPATATPDDIRGLQLHQRQGGMQPPSINTAVCPALPVHRDARSTGPGSLAHCCAPAAPAARLRWLWRCSRPSGTAPLPWRAP